MTIRLFSPAKINLHLDIVRRRDDGFHDLATIFMALDWGDDLTLTPSPDAIRDTLTAEGPFAQGVPTDERNLVLRSLARLRRDLSVPPVHAHLVKRLPSAAGLGGASSNAAAALVGANRLFDLGLDDDHLEKLLAEIGCDCAFFVRGGVQQGNARGDVLQPIDFKQLFTIVVVVPRARVNTAEAYAALMSNELGLFTEHTRLIDQLESEDNIPLPGLHNTFERGLRKRVPEIDETLNRLQDFGAERALLSGSGSACFGIFSVREEAENTVAMWDLGARALQACWPWPMGVKVVG